MSRGLELVVAAEHFHDFVDVHLLHVLASGLQVLAGIEVAGLLVEVLADGSGHGQTAVAVNVNFADCALAGFAELFFGNTNCVGQLAAVSVDGVNLFLGNRA